MALPSRNRSGSSPNLHKAHRWETQLDRHAYDHDDYLDDEFYVIGDRVYLDSFRPASVAYFGEVEFAPGDWVGLVLDQPTGSHDGKLHGREYFQCAPRHGLFVRPNRLRRVLSGDSALGSSASSSRQATPLPTFQRGTPPSPLGLQQSATRSSSRASSLFDSYYYDDDYRQEPQPTVASLARKLRSIDERKQVAAPTHRATDSIGRNSSFRGCKPTGGILKGGLMSSPHRFTESPLGDELSRLRASSTPPPKRQTDIEFSFRPKREQLQEMVEREIERQNDFNRNTPADPSIEPPRHGDRVEVRTERGKLEGILRFAGQTEFATGEWAGVELDRAEGKNDGSVLGRRYFHCPKNYGLFVPATRVKKLTGANFSPSSRDNVFNLVRSTILSPPPPVRGINSSYSPGSLSRSATPTSTSHKSSESPLCDSERQYQFASSPGFTYSNRNVYDNMIPTQQTATSTFQDRLTPNKLSYADERSKLKYSQTTPKFDEQDIEAELKRSLRLQSSPNRSMYCPQVESAKPKAVQYTFTSSKYDGNPIARRTLVFE